MVHRSVLVVLSVILFANVVFAQAPANVLMTTICEVVSKPGSFDGKIIELRADVAAGFETNILYDKSCGSRKQLPARIVFIESPDVPRTQRPKEYRKFWNLVQAYREPECKRHSIVPAQIHCHGDAVRPLRCCKSFSAGSRVRRTTSTDIRARCVVRPFDGTMSSAAEAPQL